jgi:hypothetical protein
MRTYSRNQRGRIKESGGEGKFKYDIFVTL